VITVNEVIKRMESGEKYRWVLKSESGRLREGCMDYREPIIGSDLIPENVAFDLQQHPRIRQVTGSDPAYIDFELVEATTANPTTERRADE